MSQGIANGNAASLGGSGQTSQLLYPDGTVAIGAGEIGGSGPLHTGVTVYDDTGAIQLQISGVLGAYFPNGINIATGAQWGNGVGILQNDGSIVVGNGLFKVVDGVSGVITTNGIILGGAAPFGQDMSTVATLTELVTILRNMGIGT